MSKERGISKDSIITTLESALLSAVRKKYGLTLEINIKIDEEDGDIKMTAMKRVVEKVNDPQEEISLKDAQEADPAKKIDDTFETPISLEKLQHKQPSRSSFSV
jgi:N utilization substance protein A